MKKIVAVLFTLSLVLGMFAGCSRGSQLQETKPSVYVPEYVETQPAKQEDDRQDGGNAEPIAVDFSKTDADMFTKRDREIAYDKKKAVQIQLNGTSATASAGGVKIEGSTVTIQEEATYILSGNLTNGMLIVDAPDTAKLQLVFAGVEITSETSAALYIKEADKVFVTLAEGTENTLANGGSFIAIDDSNIDAALFSKQDLTLNGLGMLTVTSPVGHGIVSKDDLVVTGGNYTIHSASHGMDANDSVRVTDANVTIDAGKDAIHAENSDAPEKGFIYISGGSIQGEAEGDGIASGAYMQILGGTIQLLVGGGSENGTKQHSDFFGGFMGGGRPGQRGPGGYQSTTTTQEASTSMKGLKAGNSMLIAAGDIAINSADDAIHSDVSIAIHGGTFRLATGDDGIHAEDTLTVTGGKIDISECYEGLEALHVDVQGGDIKLIASDDGLNAAGGTDQSGTMGGRDGMFGGRPGGFGGRPGGFGGMSNSDGSIRISGGTLSINSSGDGVDANGTLEISGGHTTIVGPTQGDTSTLDYDRTGTITGGTFIGTGSTMMAQSFSHSEQGVIAVNVGNQPAGTQILLKDGKGNTLITLEPELNFARVIISSPELVKGETYTLIVGANSGDVKAS